MCISNKRAGRILFAEFWGFSYQRSAGPKRADICSRDFEVFTEHGAPFLCSFGLMVSVFVRFLLLWYNKMAKSNSEKKEFIYSYSSSFRELRAEIKSRNLEGGAHGGHGS